MWGYAALQIPSGYLATIWSAHKLFSLSLLVSSFANVSIPFWLDFGGWIALCICRAAIGLCHASFSSCTITILSKWAPPLERSRMCKFCIINEITPIIINLNKKQIRNCKTYVSTIGSLVTTGSMLGAILALSISGLIADSSLGWPGIFYVFGSLGVIMSIILFVFVSDSPESHKSISASEITYILSHFEPAENHCKIDVGTLIEIIYLFIKT